MGCGNSSAAHSVKAESQATLSTGTISRPGSKTISTNKSLESVQRQNNEHNRADSRTTCRDSGIDSAKTNDGRRRQAAAATNSSHSNNHSAEGVSVQNNSNSPQKGLAFEVMVDHDSNPGESNQSIIAKHPPKRLLQKLELRSETKLTAEMLEEKQKATEERRKQALQERAKSSKRSSRRHQQLKAAQEYDMQQTLDQQKKIDEKIDSASKNRAKAHADIVAKQKKREMKAKQAKERARRLRDDETAEHEFDVEKDENFNADDDLDSWLDGENNAVLGSASTTSERIYDGRSSPVKRMSSNSPKKVAKGSSFDSDPGSDGEQGWVDNAYGGSHKQEAKDDFFDT